MSSVPGGKSQADLVDDMNTHGEDPILNQATVARVLGVHSSTVHRWLESGAIRAIRNPKGILKVRKSDIINFVRSSKWSDNEEIQFQLEEMSEEEIPVQAAIIEEKESDGDTTLVGDSGSGETSIDNHDRRNRRSK